MRRLEPLLCHSVPKEEPGNDDCWVMKPPRGLYAISDGASESFDPAQWARVVADRFIMAGQANERWLAGTCQAYGAMHDREAMSWSRQAAYDRGSYTTLLGVALGPTGRRATITAIGDSLAVLADGSAMVDSYPYADAEEFERNPLLVSTVMGKNQPLLQQGLATFRRQWDLTALKAPAILCMTDALGAWVLDDPSRVAVLRGLNGKAALKALVNRERAAGRMRRDDTTLLVLGSRMA